MEICLDGSYLTRMRADHHKWFPHNAIIIIIQCHYYFKKL